MKTFKVPLFATVEAEDMEQAIEQWGSAQAGDFPVEVDAEVNPALLAALGRIRAARDHCAEHGSYPEDGPGPDQCFDDWAADVAEDAIAKAGGAT